MKSKRGRPPRGEYAGKTAVMNFRIRPDTKRLLEEAAEKSGRTLSQETEHQLRRALVDMRSGPTHALMQVIGSTIDSLVNLRDPKAKWHDDPYLFEQAMAAVRAALEIFRPEGPPPPQATEEVLALGGRRQAELSVAEMLREIQVADLATSLEKQSRHQRGMARLRADLGPLADRPRIYGRTASETRQEHELGREFMALHRKAIKTPAAITAEEKQRYRALWEQLREQERIRTRTGEEK